jgi:hypothetical protein
MIINQKLNDNFKRHIIIRGIQKKLKTLLNKSSPSNPTPFEFILN